MISNGFKINNGSVSEHTENMKHFHINSPTSATTSVLFHLPTQTIVGPPNGSAVQSRDSFGPQTGLFLVSHWDAHYL